MTTAKHTPTPWKVLHDTHKIGGHPNHLFRFISTANWTEDDGDFSSTGEIIAKLTDSHNIKANAAFIVTACNSHAALVEACRFALSKQTAAGIWDDCDRKNASQLRAALALAEGGAE